MNYQANTKITGLTLKAKCKLFTNAEMEFENPSCVEVEIYFKSVDYGWWKDEPVRVNIKLEQSPATNLYRYMGKYKRKTVFPGPTQIKRHYYTLHPVVDYTPNDDPDF